MKVFIKIILLTGFCFQSFSVFACECFANSCERVVESTMVVGEIEEIFYNGRLLKEGESGFNHDWKTLKEYWEREQEWVRGRKIAWFRVIDADDSTVVGELVKVYVDIGSSCASDMSYGFYSIQWGFNKEGDTITTGVNSCTEKKQFATLKEAKADYQKNLKRKAECLEIKSKGEFPFEIAFQPFQILDISPKTREQVLKKFKTIEPTICDTNLPKYPYEKIYVTFMILSTGQVHETKVVKGLENDENRRHSISKQYRSYTMPQIKLADGGEFLSYQITIPLCIESY